MRNETRDRRAFLMVAVLAVMVTVSSILLSMLPNLLRLRREGRFDNVRLQAELLAQAGVMRATSQLQNNSNYRGEEWRVPIHKDSKDLGIVRIEILGNPSESREVRIVARFVPNGIEEVPNAYEHSVQTELQLKIQTLPSEDKQGDKK